MTLPPRNFAKRGRDKGLRSASHRLFVRVHLCIAWKRMECEGKVDCCHVRDVAPNGHGGGKPDDVFTVSMCRRHHRESEKREAEWGREYGLDVLALALEFAEQSPDKAIRRAARAFRGGKNVDVPVVLRGVVPR